MLLHFLEVKSPGLEQTKARFSRDSGTAPNPAVAASRFAGFRLGSSVVPLIEPPRCGYWTPYEDKKCLKIAEKAGYQSQEDAEVICDAFSEEFKRESFPKLITVKTQKEQNFMHNFLFNENHILEGVWLGLKQNVKTGKFEWNDGSALSFSNWANQSITDDEHKCVQMESGKGAYPAGKWVKVHCQIKTTVVCERIQTWSLATLQTMFLSYKTEKEKTEQQWRQETSTLKKEIEYLKQRTGVPVGFIYAQLPGQASPETLWPKTTWKDISITYAGLFFRVLGGNATRFGAIQEADSTRLAQVESTRSGSSKNPLTIPPDGKWSDVIYTGSDTGTLHYWRIRMSGGEVRPRNQAVKIWQSAASAL